MSHRKWFGYARTIALALLALGFVASNAAADDHDREPIVGLWLLTVSGGGFSDNVFSGWTKDGLEFDQDAAAPILTGYVCYGHWIKLKDHTYGTLEYKLVVLESVFSYRSQRYGSLSAVARQITGSHWSGTLFFGLKKRTQAEPGDGAQ